MMTLLDRYFSNSSILLSRTCLSEVGTDSGKSEDIDIKCREANTPFN